MYQGYVGRVIRVTLAKYQVLYAPLSMQLALHVGSDVHKQSTSLTGRGDSTRTVLAHVVTRRYCC